MKGPWARSLVRELRSHVLSSAAFMGCGGNVGRVAVSGWGKAVQPLGLDGPAWVGGVGTAGSSETEVGGANARAGAGLLAPHPLVQRLPVSEFTN